MTPETIPAEPMPAGLRALLTAPAFMRPVWSAYRDRLRELDALRHGTEPEPPGVDIGWSCAWLLVGDAITAEVCNPDPDDGSTYYGRSEP